MRPELRVREVFMNRQGNAGGGTHRAALLSVVLLALAACGSTKAAKGTGGSGSGIAQGQCGPGDSTESCCLKTHPGQYEYCGAIPPKKPAPGVPAPLLPSVPELPTEDKRKEYLEICLPYYSHCVDRGGASKDGRVWNETRCKQCFEACKRFGYWPARANNKVCP